MAISHWQWIPSFFIENVFRISDKLLLIPGIRYEWLEGSSEGRNGITNSGTAINLQKLCTNYDALFVMNDRVQLTGKLKLDAVHIGIEDISLIDARKIVGTNCIIGVSCYGNIELAKNAALQGADYVAFGACFSSTTKPQNKTIDKTENSTLSKNFIFKFSISKVEDEDGNEIQKIKINLKNKEKTELVWGLYTNIWGEKKFFIKLNLQS